VHDAGSAAAVTSVAPPAAPPIPVTSSDPSRRVSTPVRAARHATSDAPDCYDVSPVTNSGSLHYLKRPKQAHQPYQPPASSRAQSRSRASTSSLAAAHLPSGTSRAPSISMHSDRDLSVYRSRLTSDSLFAAVDWTGGKENWAGGEPLAAGRDSLGIAYGESYTKLIEDVPGYPSRGTVLQPLRERAQQQQQQQRPPSQGRASSTIIRPEPPAASESAAAIGRAVSRYSHYQGGGGGGGGLARKENSGLTVRSGWTGDSGIKAFV
jgi:hypothetical protein